MNSLFTRGMARATALTRTGKLQQATDLIQSLLRSPAPEAVQPEAGDVIDGSFTALEPKPKPAAVRKRTPNSRLAETLRKTAAGGMPAGVVLPGTAVPVPQGAQFLALSHDGPQGSRSYRLYIPARRPRGQMPLVVMLHGCTQTPEDFAAGTGMNVLAEEFGCLIAYPAQAAGANVQKCWNWFRPEDQGRDRGEPALIAGITQAILRDHAADPARVYVAGLSAGGAAAVLVAAAYPEMFSAVGVHSGLPAGAAQDIPSAFAAMRSGSSGAPHQAALPTIVFHGLADSTVHPQNAAAILSQALPARPGLKTTERQGTSEGGRKFSTTTHQQKDGRSFAELWEIEGAGHAWAGGTAAGSYTDPQGPDASRQMIRFFLQHKRS